MDRWLRLPLGLGSALALSAGCNAILGVDQDYVVGSGGSGASTPSGAPTGTTSTGTTGTGTETGGGGTGGTSSGTAGGTGGTGTGTASTGGGAATVTYDATVADCIDTTAPDPDGCADPPQALWIDQPTTEAFIRFDTDGAIAGATVTSATLLLTVGSYPQAQGDTSGELWETSSFTRAELANGAPARVGSRLVADQGPVDPGDTISWSLPVGLVAPNASIHLGLYPTSYNSVGYLNLQGASVPRLVVEYQ